MANALTGPVRDLSRYSVHIKIKTPDGYTLEWTVKPQGNLFVVKQVDRSGTLRVPFPSADLAVSWVITNAEYFRSEWKAVYVVD